MNHMRRSFLAFMGLLLTAMVMNAQVTMDSSKLSRKQQHIVILSGHAAVGNLEKLSAGFHMALNAGMTINEAKEMMIHLYAYCGFPRSLRGLQTLMTVLDSRKQKGIVDSIGRAASPVNDSTSKFDRGKTILSQLTGIQDPPVAAYAAFAPEIEVFLKEHLFADIFERDVLTYTERELVTIAVLANTIGVEPMLQSHYKICLNLGFTAQQLQHFVTIVNHHHGKNASTHARLVLEAVLTQRK